MMKYQLYLIVFSFLIYSCQFITATEEKEEDEMQEEISGEKQSKKIEGVIDASFRNVVTYVDRSMFAAKRRDQIDTANRILGMEEYSKQYKMVELLMETIFPAMNDSWIKANESNYIAGASPYPTNEKMQGIVGIVFEGVPFFGDILLRLPHITKDIYKRQIKEYESILIWGLEFCRNTSTIFNGHHATQLHLISQEIGLIPEDPDYINPFRTSEAERRINNAKVKPKKQKSKKGPKLRTRKTEL